MDPAAAGSVLIDGDQMAVKLIAENILSSDKFLSATEQEGEYIGQPVPDSGNTGAFRLLAKGDIQDFTYNGTCTGEVPDTTSVIDSILAAFGDDYFIGGTVTFTSGDNNGETEAVTDFAQATGDLTCDAFTNVVNIGDDFTLTVAFASRDFRAELIASGDAGDATFKWSHNGGTTYLGRDAPTQADWLAEIETHGSIESGISTSGRFNRMLVADNGDWIVFYTDETSADTHYEISTNKGLTWGSSTFLHTSPFYSAATKLSSGRLFVCCGENVRYSDDNGVTWQTGVSTPTTFYDLVELPNGNIAAVKGLGDSYCYISSDGGSTWSDPILIDGTGYYPTISLTENGNLICAYIEDADVANHEIHARISVDGCATWGDAITVLAPVGVNIWYPDVKLDRTDGTLYCCATKDTADAKTVFSYSIDDGETWAAEADLKSVAGVDLSVSRLMFDGNWAVCTYVDKTNHDLDMVRRGMWEAYSANACPCAIEADEQKFICDVGGVWHGWAGVVGDKWQFEAEYDYAMSNIIEDSPNKPWRSEQDNIACNIVIDLGANERFWADGVGFFNSNVRTADFQMNATNAWGGPSVDEAVSFDLVTGTVDAVSGNAIQDTSLLADYKDHELKANKHFLRMTSGVDDTVTWEIKDNVGDYIFLDTTAAINVAGTDTFVIFQDHVAKTFTGGVYRFINVAIAVQRTADDYYQFGMVVMGRSITLTRDFGVGYSKDHKYDIQMLRPPKGGIVPIKRRDRKRIFALPWPATEETRQEVAALLDYNEGKNIVLIPDSSDMKDCYLVKHIGDLKQKHRFVDRMDQGPVILEEV